MSRGTDGSNPLPSSGESRANLTFRGAGLNVTESARYLGRQVPALIAVFELRAAPVLTENSKVKGDGSKNPWSPPLDVMLQRG